jgi:ferredoxin-nitrite reductase
MAHVGIHPQKHPGFVYVGVVLPVGRLSSDQMRALAQLSEQYGTGTIRLTVWQNLLISDIPQELADQVVRRLSQIGLGSSATTYRAGLVACTGNAGCKFAASNTKSHGLALANHLESTVPLDVPINIHLTGCHHSCAQHYIGDIGLLATKVAKGEDMVEGYHIYLGGGFGCDASIAFEFQRDVPFDLVPTLLEGVLKTYLLNRSAPDESFHQYAHKNLLQKSVSNL